MQYKSVGITVLMMVFLCGDLAAQARPDFSGTWTLVAEPGGAGTAGRPAAAPVFGQQFVVRQQGEKLSLTRAFAGIPATIQYVLDGSETTSRMPGRLCEPDSGATWTASWDGNGIALAMISAVPPNGTPIKMDVRSVMRLESADTLAVEVTARQAGQAAPRTSKAIYKRTGDAPVASGADSQIQKARSPIAQIGWLSGVWVGTSRANTVEERWTTAAGGSMLAVSRTIRNGVMVAFEFLCICERDGGLVYTAMPNGRTPATDFTLTQIDTDSATFENPAHDFPKMIRYVRRPDGTLEAVISAEAGQRAQTFVFKRQD